ncbi:MAG: DUF3047 domain-containing protein [Candidatus Omnitrophica bacterium]|nr:DUF3047 domain-containing protein [Candidatus Omnitrophota bacterium]
MTYVKEKIVSWRKDFGQFSVKDTADALKGWKMQGKPGTRKAVFSIESDNEQELSYLRMRADRASGSLITSVDGVDLEKTPILRWRWRALKLPKGADGRYRSKDDQAIGIYVGTGSAIDNKSVSYRWDTDTPKGTEGEAYYGLGGVKIKWYTLRNAEDGVGSKWYVEERNVADDFRRAWGFCPEKIYLAVSCNSQYTKSSAIADLEWIEFAGEDDRK